MDIRLSDFDYWLPEEKIAKFPLEKREDAKLLIYRSKTIEHFSFTEIVELIPHNATLFFNDTRVIPARLYFHKATGALIEIFLLKPIDPAPVQVSMQQTSTCTWSCMIGNLKKWKAENELIRRIEIKKQTVTLTALLVDKNTSTIKFSWDNAGFTFAEILEYAGETPLPPYLNRKPVSEDRPRYQTVYSKKEGAVAAPTAGLHFTEEILNQLSGKGIHTEYLTLHVSAGTFQPVKEENVVSHPMHSEVVIISLENINALLENPGKTIAVGTTSMRTLESLYWYGVKLLEGNQETFKIDKLEPYESRAKPLPSKSGALMAVREFMKNKSLKEIYGVTEIFIFPGYKFRICDGLITNFHLPKSTLILLIAAFIGEDWRKVYQEALGQGYRFLSYGDSSFLLP